MLKLLSEPTKWKYNVIVTESIISNGATHFLDGVLHEIKKQGKNAIYVSGESLLSGFQKKWRKRFYR